MKTLPALGPRCARAVGGVLAAGACLMAAGAIPGSSPPITLSDPVRDYELRGAALSADGATLHLISAAYPKGSPTGATSLIWTTVDPSGKVISQKDPFATLPPAEAATLTGRDAGTGLALTSDGRAFLVLQPTTGNARLVQLPRATEAATVRAIDFGGSPPDIRRVLTAPKDQLLLIGSGGSGQPLVAIIGLDGKILSQYELHQAPMAIVAGIIDPDGTAMVVGEKGLFPQSTTWVARLSASGEVLKTVEFPGQPTDIAKGADGTYVLLIEKTGDLASSDMLIKGLGPDLAERWAGTLVTGTNTGTFFRAVALPAGGFIVAGSKDRGLWVSRLKADGTKVWTDAHDPASSPEMELVSQVQLVSARGHVVVAYSPAVSVGREQRRLIREIRFTAN